MAAEAKAPLLDGRRGATPAQTLGNIVVSIVGTGVLGLPYAFRTAGWLAGALGVAAAGAATFYCMLLLVSCASQCTPCFPVFPVSVPPVSETEFIIIRIHIS